MDLKEYRGQKATIKSKENQELDSNRLKCLSRNRTLDEREILHVN
jgi:hypothetical protein